MRWMLARSLSGTIGSCAVTIDRMTFSLCSTL
jgi:hypothetical protein